MDPTDALIHQPVRLRIMALLWRHRDVSYTRTRDHLGLTDGNLATHIRRLEEAGLLEARRVLRGRHGFHLRYRITPHGLDAFRHYLNTMRTLLDEAEAS